MTVAGRALRYIRTARHLRWSQWLYRPLRRAQRVLSAPEAPRVAVDRGAREALAVEVATWVAHRPDGSADAIAEGRFRFLNEERFLNPVHWSRRHGSHLWSYNLHYFDYAVDLAAAYRCTGDTRYVRRFEELALEWIESTDPGHGDGWEPYPVSLRAVNWIYALLLVGDSMDVDSRSRIERSLARQLAFLERRLEYHILANHLLKNLKALAVGGLYFEGRAARHWLEKGEAGAWKGLWEQILPDGGHYERSPMYHAVVTSDFLELVALLRAWGRQVPEGAEERLRSMVRAFGVLCRPDGSLHLLNDAANGIAPSRTWLDGLGRQVVGEGVSSPEGHVMLPNTGYHAFADADQGIRLLVDAGPPGPSYQPGHSHCDMLSFELDLAGRPFVVDSGVHGYDDDPYREYVRSTRAHNTVMIDGREQSEVWSTFRMARRGEMLGGSSSLEQGEFRFEGRARPYHAKAVHVRRIVAWGGRWTITDRVDGAKGSRVDAFLHLHPDWSVAREGDQLVARAGAAVVAVEPRGVDHWRIVKGSTNPVQGWYCPEFGKALPAPTLHMTVDTNDGGELGCVIEVLESGDG